MPLSKAEIVADFTALFDEAPRWVVRAPGRVNLIGEHTDYNDGFVLPMAIDRAVWIALRPRDDNTVRVRSQDFAEWQEFLLPPQKSSSSSTGWVEYLKGVAWSLGEAGFQLRGWEGVLRGDVPVGAGLSSSAALELATARAFAAVSDWPWKPSLMARLAQRAENQWVGVNCGIMDQLISAAGRAGHALLLDCRSLHYDLVPLPPQTAVAVLDTATRRDLVNSAYNKRRAECATAASFLGVPTLRDVTDEHLANQAQGMESALLLRARHVISENRRTLSAAEAMRRGDAALLGRLFYESHCSLRDDFQVSCPALDTMVECALEHEACLGARMTGAGFGGCAIALVRQAGAESFLEQVAARYRQRTGLTPAVYLCHAADGAALV